MNKDEAIKELFYCLDYAEESDSGRTFRAVQISCVRNDILIRMEAALKTLKESIVPNTNRQPLDL